MRCEGTSARPEGRWARLEDVAGLREYQAAYNEERGTQTDRDWPAAIGRRGVAVVERAGRIASVLCRSGETRRVACIGGTYTFPDFRRCGLASRLTAFMVGDLLGEHDAVQLVVDDDNVAAIALYRGIGFETIGGCYMAYLD
jgi:predicted GNAT family acetyltransferase